MRIKENANVVLAVFRQSSNATRNSSRVSSIPHSRFTGRHRFPTAKPSGNSTPCLAKVSTWAETWDPLQPTAAERQMDPRVVAVSDQEVVVLWRQRGLSSIGERFVGGTTHPQSSHSAAACPGSRVASASDGLGRPDRPVIGFNAQGRGARDA